MSDDKIRNYFLGNLDLTEAENFEEEISADSDLTEYAQMIESELIEDYLRGGLAPSERSSFENSYLTTETRRQKLSLAQIFLQNISEKPQNKIAAKPQTSLWQSIFDSLQLKIAFAALVLLFGSIITFFFLRSDNQNETARQQTPSPIATIEISNNNISNSNPDIQKTNPDSNLEKPKNSNESKSKIEPSPTATPKKFEPVQPSLATFALLPGTLRSGGEQFIKIPFKTNKVSLKLTLPKDAAAYENYSITVKTSNGETIFIVPNRRSPNVTIPAAKFENQTYIIFLSGNTAAKTAESIAEYTFRVRREK